jgi:hypothetical protein
VRTKAEIKVKKNNGTGNFFGVRDFSESYFRQWGEVMDEGKQKFLTIFFNLV